MQSEIGAKSEGDQMQTRVQTQSSQELDEYDFIRENVFINTIGILEVQSEKNIRHFYKSCFLRLPSQESHLIRSL